MGVSDVGHLDVPLQVRTEHASRRIRRAGDFIAAGDKDAAAHNLDIVERRVTDFIHIIRSVGRRVIPPDTAMLLVARAEEIRSDVRALRAAVTGGVESGPPPDDPPESD